LVARRELVLEQALGRKEIVVAPKSVGCHEDVVALEDRAWAPVKGEAVRYAWLHVARTRNEAIPRRKVVLNADDVVMKAKSASRTVEHCLPHRRGAGGVTEPRAAANELELREVQSTEHESQIATRQPIEGRAFLTIAHEKASCRLAGEVAPNAEDRRDWVLARRTRDLLVIHRRGQRESGSADLSSYIRSRGGVDDLSRVV